jgi:hypothetical protein
VPLLVARQITLALGDQLFIKCDVFVMDEMLHFDLPRVVSDALHRDRMPNPCYDQYCSRPRFIFDETGVAVG